VTGGRKGVFSVVGADFSVVFEEIAAERNPVGPIVDVHTHAFPDALADRAMARLSAEVPGLPYYHDGRVGSLLASMDRAGIDISVVCSIATRPEQFEPILRWSAQIRSDRIVPLPSVHPADPDVIGHIEKIAAEGFKGIKLHPYYQQFVADEARMEAVYGAVSACGLILVMHTGYDIAFERVDRAGPQRIMGVLQRWPDLKLVTTHMGGWSQWDQVGRMIIGRCVYMETSFVLDGMDDEAMRRMLTAHPADYILFGTDSPWDDQKRALERVRGLGLGPELERKILSDNALRLLEI